MDSCAVCLAEISSADPATEGHPCKCNGTIKYHPLCYEDMCGSKSACPICKAQIKNSEIFGPNWIVKQIDFSGYRKEYYTFDDDRQKHGKYMIIDRRYKRYVIEAGQYVHGLKHGLYQHFNAESNVVEERSYNMGKLHGHIFGKKITNSSELKYSLNYRNGLLHGPADVSRIGKLIPTSNSYTVFGKATGNFKDGMMDGTFKIYDQNGGILESIEYKNDLKDGEAVFYDFENPRCVVQRMHFKEGSVCGKLIIYWAHTGTERFTCIMRNDGMVIGPVYYNDESGDLIERRVCKKGEYLVNLLPEDVRVRRSSGDIDTFEVLVNEKYFDLDYESYYDDDWFDWYNNSESDYCDSYDNDDDYDESRWDYEPRRRGRWRHY